MTTPGGGMAAADVPGTAAGMVATVGGGMTAAAAGGPNPEALLGAVTVVGAVGLVVETISVEMPRLVATASMA